MSYSWEEKQISCTSKKKYKEKLFREAFNGFGNGLTFEDQARNSKKPARVEFGYGKINPNDSNAFKRKSKP